VARAPAKGGKARPRRRSMPLTGLPMPEPRAGDVIQRMMSAYLVSTDAELAQRLAVSTSTVASWRSRNSIPFRECVLVASQTGRPLDWLVRGSEAGRAASFSGPEIDIDLLAVVISERRFDGPNRHSASSWLDDERRARVLIDEYARYLDLMNRAVASGQMTREQFIVMLRAGASRPRPPTRARRSS